MITSNWRLAKTAWKIFWRTPPLWGAFLIWAVVNKGFLYGYDHLSKWIIQRGDLTLSLQHQSFESIQRVWMILNYGRLFLIPSLYVVVSVGLIQVLGDRLLIGDAYRASFRICYRWKVLWQAFLVWLIIYVITPCLPDIVFFLWQHSMTSSLVNQIWLRTVPSTLLMSYTVMWFWVVLFIISVQKHKTITATKEALKYIVSPQQWLPIITLFIGRSLWSIILPLVVHKPTYTSHQIVVEWQWYQNIKSWTAPIFDSLLFGFCLCWLLLHMVRKLIVGKQDEVRTDVNTTETDGGMLY